MSPLRDPHPEGGFLLLDKRLDDDGRCDGKRHEHGDLLHVDFPHRDNLKDVHPVAK